MSQADLLPAAIYALHDAVARLIVLGYTPHEVASELDHFTDSLRYPEVSPGAEGENE